VLALVTGGGGFLGGYIAEQLLARGDQVRALVRRPAPRLEASGAQLVRGDLADASAVEQACAGVDVVFHVAAVAGIWGPWKRYFEANVLGTRNILHGCRKHGVKRLVFTSSPSVTFAGDDQKNVDESAPYPTRWLAYYPHTKAIAEQEVLAANSSSLATCALRPHLIWGPRDQHLIPRLLDRAKSGRLRQVGDGKNTIDAIFVENAAEAHLQAADALAPTSPVAGKAYFLSNGEPVNCWSWINEILKIAGTTQVKKQVSLPLAYMAGSLLEGAWTLLRRQDEPPMTRFLALQLAKDHWFDISAARRDFGYQPRISMAQGMERLASELRRPS
jgi:nucleoside-diphosphate-sugar epimerase